MAALKTLLILAVLAIVLYSTAAEWVQPCDQVCNRIPPERDECCRAHGKGRAFCWRGMMWCNDP
ncbi:spodomicin-like [Leguminivora glycinivorella]|uniref:spodomicin-like n=1 Tax=Leguminivora glycinivorella TaxID=1035111 RepID=UPI00200DB3D2|nr:spodomicin-like [Leguminivora glycinivorella]XP_048002772.1 spodomicin-like [Leguminivora glycinivorella]